MLQFDHKIPAAVLGATGNVGQRLVQLLEDHPWFELIALCGSERSVGKRYREACNWLCSPQIPEGAADMLVQPINYEIPVQIVFSALPANISREVEPRFARTGAIVCSNSSAYRYENDVPLMIPEINPGHLALVDLQRRQRDWPGMIITSPNCTTTGIALALNPLSNAFGVGVVFATTMQAVSGAGYPGVPAMQISGNVIPHIPGEDEKIELETRILLGEINDHGKAHHSLQISAQANRVDVIDGHTASLSVKLASSASVEEIGSALSDFSTEQHVQNLPSAPSKPLVLSQNPGWPQPRISSHLGGGMQVSVGQIRPCSILDFKLTIVVHNTMRGAAGGAILNAKLAAATYLIKEYCWTTR